MKAHFKLLIRAFNLSGVQTTRLAQNSLKKKYFH